MNELDRMRKLAGILTESVMAVPGVGQSMDEKAPPGMEDMVMNLKKEYPGHEEKAFATAWSIYNKKHGKAEESSMMEDSPLDLEIQSAIEMFNDLEHNGYGPEEIVSTIEQSFRDDGFEDADIARVMSAIQQHIESDEEPEEGGICPACNGSGEGRYDGSSCSSCGGSGEERSERDSDDFNEPDEYDPDDAYMGPLEEAMPIDQSKLDDALDSLIRVMNSGADDAESESAWIAKTHNVPAEALAHAYAQYKAEEIGRSGMMEEVEEEAEEVDEAFDLNNGYDDIRYMKAGDFFPDGADSPVVSSTGASGARQGDNDEQKKMAVAETHKELVYNYRKFLKESAKK